MGHYEMNSGRVESAVWTQGVPGPVRTLSSLPEVDYADWFSLSTDVKATPERWARAMFGDVPSPGERLIWRGLLGLRLSRERSLDTVGGWRIGGSGEDWIRLEAASWFLAGNLVVRTAGGRVTLVTFLHYRRRLGRGVWPPLSAVHRRIVPGVLRDAATRVAARARRVSARPQFQDILHAAPPGSVDLTLDPDDVPPVPGSTAEQDKSAGDTNVG
jgi:hypothetical protein